MAERKPLLSVIIPTRNRADYARSAMSSVLRVPSELLELVVEDNSDEDVLREWLAERTSEARVVYHHTARRLSMQENYELAVGRATGEYVAVIGDDDGVNPELMAAAEWARANGFDALVPSTPAHFVWPDLEMSAPGALRAGEFRVRPFTGEHHLVDPTEELSKCLASAAQSFCDLPKLYYGLVRRSCLVRLKEVAGSFFPGVSPDMSVAVGLSQFVGRVCKIDYPLFLPGSSRRSNAGLSGLGKHIGKLSEQPHLPSTVERDWSGLVPPFFSVETVWAEAAVGALKAVGRQDLLAKFNWPVLYTLLLMWHPRFALTSLRTYPAAVRASGLGPGRGAWRLACELWNLWALRVRLKLMSVIGRSASTLGHTESALANIDEAALALGRFLRSRGMRFGGLVDVPSVTPL